MTFLPSGLYAPTATAAAFNARQEQQQQLQSSTGSMISGLIAAKKGTSPMVHAPAEKKIELYSAVRSFVIRPYLVQHCSFDKMPMSKMRILIMLVYFDRNLVSKGSKERQPDIKPCEDRPGLPSKPQS